MNYILLVKIASICIGSVLLVLSLPFIYISLGFRFGKMSKTRGYLSQHKHEKNVYKGGKAGRWYKHWMEYTYQYRVDGNEYRVNGSNPGKPNEIPKTVLILYQTKHPQYAYAKNLTLPTQPFVAAVCLILGLLFLICGVCMSI